MILKRRLAIRQQNEHLASLIPIWVESTKEAKISTGLEVDQALRRALDLREGLRCKTQSPVGFRLDVESVETLHALCALLDGPEDTDPTLLLSDCTAAFGLISTLEWPKGKFGGRDDLLSRLAFLGWRYARQAGEPATEFKWTSAHGSIEGATVRSRAECILATSLEEHKARWSELHLEDPEQLLAMCDLLRDRLETTPALVRDEAIFLHEFIRTPRRKIGIFDEREFYLGESALIAGVACRMISRREESRQWFDRAEANFALVHNSSAHFARLAYQRLALRLEERDFDAVMEFAPLWVETLQKLDLPKDALKCRFLKAHALKETEQLAEAKEAFLQIAQEARYLKEDRLLAIAAQNIFQIHAFLGEVDQAVAQAEEAAQILRRLDNRVNLAKLQLGIGYLFREQGRLMESIAAFREAQRQFAQIEMPADVAATHFVLADLLLDAGQAAQAEWEIRAALPIIDELKLVPEGIAAVSLLRDSLRRRQIDRHALRSLNGHFEELKS